MNITQEKLLLVCQIQAANNTTFCTVLKDLNQKEVDPFTHSFIQDMLRFFENRSDQFYAQVRRYDVKDFALYMDYMDESCG
ncbi:hypothetical protein [Faecalitalea cylindroides]|uniref:Uncharacterized protein n=1 Tax=Faecalitalea cylindroides TaxID=39483 RepID=A0AAW6FRE2_9FIRM|nr:hypothetical protein [Faecalitalea cylindroides]MDC0828000.1 hypothetical protein [Faecalitalea cylindroides]